MKTGGFAGFLWFFVPVMPVWLDVMTEPKRM
jgi:hypothetical protein